jgi:fused signal recognition particle receptor
MDSVFSGSGVIDEDFYEELEETLIMGDIGVRTTEELLEELREQVKKQRIKDPMDCRKLLIDSIRARMRNDYDAYEFLFHTSVIFVIGVNGVGKTTTIGKLAAKFRSQHKKVVIAAADTFRAAAGEQLKVWADRADAELVSGIDGADPSAVVFDAIASAKAKKADVLLIDTAGRLHNKKNLMDELAKMNRIIDREFPGAYKETFVVVDATTGQNALSQAKEFREAAEATGVILTKMD